MKKLWIFAAAAMFATACSNDDEPVTPGQESRLEVSIDPMILQMDSTTGTRATDLDFENGDKVGLNIKMVDDQSLYADNALFVFNGTKFVAETPLLWYEDIGLKSDLTAYYPYASATPAEFTVAADQSTKAGYTASDFMIASKNGVTPTYAATSMLFEHKLTKLVCNVDNQWKGTQIKSITFKGMKPAATIDWAAKSVAVKAEAEAQDVKALEVKSGQQYAAIIIPQTAKLQMEVTVQTADQEKVALQTYKEVELKNGQYTVSITVLAEGIQAEISGEIQNWTDNGELQPEQGGGEPEVDPNFQEFDDHFVYYGETYKIKEFGDGRVWMTENLRYVPEGQTVSSDPTDKTAHIWCSYTVKDKVATPDPSIETARKVGYLYDHEIAFGTKIMPDMAATLEGAQGICPKGWHIPTSKEYGDLFGYVQSSSISQEYVNPDAPFFNKDWMGAKHSEVEAGGWNIVNSRPGCRFIATSDTATGRYQTVTAKDGTLGLTYFMCSTYYQGTSEIKQQFWGLMTSMLGNYIDDGRLHVAFNNINNGSAIRCIKDK